MKALLQAWAQEYRNIFSDFGVLLIFFGAILFYPLFYPIPYSNEVLKENPVAAVDLDHSDLSRKVIRMLDANQFICIASRPDSLVEAQKKLFERKVDGIVVIPQGFQRKIFRGEQGVIVTYADAGYFLIYRQIVTGISQIVGTLSMGIQVSRLTATGLLPEQAMAAATPLKLISYPLFNRPGGYSSYIVPPVLILILQQTLLIGIGMLGGTAREYHASHYLSVGWEKKSGLISTILGKAGAYFSLYILHSVFFFTIIFRLHQYPQRGDLLVLLWFIVPYLLSVIFLGMALASLFRIREVAMAVLVFTSIPILFLSGFAWPAGSIPGSLTFFAHFIPSTAGIDGFLKLYLMGATMRDTMADWCVLWGLVIFYFTLAYLAWARILKIYAFTSGRT